MKYGVLLSTIIAAGLALSGCRLSSFDGEFDNPLDPDVDAPIEDVLTFVVDDNLDEAIRDTNAQFKSEVMQVRVFQKDVGSLDGIEYFNNINYLELNDANIASLDTDLSPILQLENLQSLNLMANGYTDQNVASIPHFPRISFLSLGFNDLTDAASLVPIVERYGRAQLYLDIQEMPIEADTLTSLRPVLDRISGLSISNFNHPAAINPITDLNFLEANDTITEIELGGLSIADYTPLDRLSALRQVGIHAWPDTDLNRFPSLSIETLNVDSSSLTSLTGLPSGLSELVVGGSSALTDISQLATSEAQGIRRLNISRTPLDETDMAVLSSLQNLELIAISNVPALTTLAFLVDSPNLQWIFAGNNPNLTAGLDALVSLTALEELWIESTGFSQSDVDAFRAERPDVAVHYP